MAKNENWLLNEDIPTFKKVEIIKDNYEIPDYNFAYIGTTTILNDGTFDDTIICNNGKENLVLTRIDLARIGRDNIHRIDCVQYEDEYKSLGDEIYSIKLDGILYLASGLSYDTVLRIDGKLHYNPVFKKWLGMIDRCHKKESYKNVSICDEWKSYDNFKIWYDDNYPHRISELLKKYGYKMELDKDLLQKDVEFKVYSPSTCVFIPDKLNRILPSISKQSDSTGVKLEKNGKFSANIKDLGTGSIKKLGIFENKEDARLRYIEEKNKHIEALVNWLKDLKYDKNIVSALESWRIQYDI